MKRVASLLMTILFLFNTMGYYFVFSYSRYLFRTEMKRCIKAGCFERSCVILRIKDPASCPDFQRINKGEFRYRSELYDIVSEHRSGDVTVFRCINDNREERLLTGFHHFIEFNVVRNNPAKARHALALQHHLIKLALINSLRSSPPEIPVKIQFSENDRHLVSIFYPPPSPPPRSS